MKRTEQSAFGRFFKSRWFLLVILVIIAFIAIGFARAYYQDYKVRQQIKELEEQVQTLNNQKIELIDLFKRVSSPEYVEEKARTELNLKKPGENVLFVNDKNIVENTPAKSDRDVDSVVLSNPIKWWYYFIHKR